MDLVYVLRVLWSAKNKKVKRVRSDVHIDTKLCVCNEVEIIDKGSRRSCALLRFAISLFGYKNLGFIVCAWAVVLVNDMMSKALL